MLLENLIWSCFKDAYGAVAYTRRKNADGYYEPRLATSKNRTASIKVVDIVRLELSRAVISKRLMSTIVTEARMSFNIVYHIVNTQ